MSKRIRHLDRKLDLARKATRASYLLFLLSMWLGGLTGINPTPASLLVIVSLPLILFLPGMARENHKSLSMLSFVALMYFIPLVWNVSKPEYSAFDITSLIFICILFTAAMLYSRWIQYHRAGLGDP